MNPLSGIPWVCIFTGLCIGKVSPGLVLVVLWGSLERTQNPQFLVFILPSSLRCLCSTGQHFNICLLSRKMLFCSLFLLSSSVVYGFPLHSVPLNNLNPGNFPKSSWCLMKMLKTAFIFSNSSGCQTISLLLCLINRDVCMKTEFLKFFFSEQSICSHCRSCTWSHNPLWHCNWWLWKRFWCHVRLWLQEEEKQWEQMLS